MGAKIVEIFENHSSMIDRIPNLNMDYSEQSQEGIND
jgi:hypothetical protein